MAIPLPSLDLTHHSDFEPLVSPDGYISICGYGSLLSETSARTTFPDLVNFRIARLTGFRRLFNSVGRIFFTHRVANIKTQEIAGLSVEPCDGEFVVVAVFEIKNTEIPAFIEREREYRFLAVVPETLDGKPFINPAVLCASYTDEEFFKFRCSEGREKYFEQYGEYKIHKIWRDDVFPCRVYLRHCVLAAKSLGDEVHNNFLDHTFLADRKTTIRQYFEKVGTSILEEEPPESLKTRYGG
ncbi:hypothetical protein AAZX31_07G226700 [Glycine max]|uniref:Gamma-glutamylcyclotransferase AIG2-like domain-containing protein n=2 Tax=Glycine subgen. Soja TaxID=1462606 RepID=I1KMW1_SOYBN|nr:uncharacterized protein LOC100527697 [Glycine max]XP_028241650.1 uncharacterized protein LOC114420011 [Glycine soja]KAG5144040.1 hypothetical protein JHK82_019735 [Glycine max]KAH1088428.1 hypothetical protein GYH30_019457 [Glycine max]KHN02938.1 hypothetical protein glysoja_009804 [Glycine soja]KRH50798.1 hypothetical protein GLYMA_07G244600v4 [Glycine max]RZC04473.1 hypothetical protein D0Y65_018873 [Glycine soja]|eukprot:NP_001236139.2 uncharacterized protein LOC100527697 [Glycine max]